MTGTLYIIATPIGNLEDITLRALNTLKESDLIVAEDTRKTKVLLKHYDINKPTLSYFQHSGEEKKFEILSYLLDGENLALVTDAGTPGISDPGNELIEFLLSYKPDIKIVPVPGASAITAALSVSGFRADRFLFIGFWPKKKVNKLIEVIKLTKSTIVFYESPKRILKTLETLEKALGKQIRVFVARELTKMHETLYRGKIFEVRGQLEKEKIRGEIVVVVET